MNSPIPTTSQASALLSAAPTIVAPPSAPGASQTGVPSQKLVAGGIGGVLTWVIVAALNKYAGVTLPADIVAYVVALALAYLVPPSQRDLIDHLTDEVVHAAQRDPDSNVSSVLAPTAPVPGQPAVITPPDKKGV